MHVETDFNFTAIGEEKKNMRIFAAFNNSIRNPKYKQEIVR